MESKSGINQSTEPKDGPKNLKGPKQEWPGTANELNPKPDHGEETYKGANKLVGKKALITGGDSGIGRAIALAFAREGADVAICHLEEERDDAVETLKWVKEAGRKGFMFAGDLQEPETCRSLVRDAVEALGGLDILVNNAAYQHKFTELEELTQEELERTFRTNFFAYVYMAQAALKYMDKGATIINTTSVNALKGNEDLLDYSATKAAILNFTKSLAPQLAKREIRVNAVAPGPVWTPLIASTLPDSVKGFGKNTLWERAAQPIEIATSFVFLASADSRYFTGQVLSPTGTTEGAR
jgi:NAD(P)-dependent dehydrogenase (short-subunit alcohol dehydrogenase family)